MSRLYASISGGLIAGMAAFNSGLPVWRDMPPGDATDFAVVTALFVWFSLGTLTGTGGRAK